MKASNVTVNVSQIETWHRHSNSRDWKDWFKKCEVEGESEKAITPQEVILQPTLKPNTDKLCFISEKHVLDLRC